jgi:hypothetical protein
MSCEDFENRLRELIRKRPFEPFVVERLDGSQVQITHPGVAFGGGAATYFTPSYDLVEFACEDVRDFHPVVQETAQ